MDPSREEVEIPMPLNSAYPSSHIHGHVPNMLFHQHHYHDHDHDHHHHHDEQSHSHTHLQVTPSNGPLIPIALNHENHHHEHVLLSNSKQGGGGGGQVRYRECLKNYAASMGGRVTDGCGEFMPSGEEGEIEALTCSVCNCHRNFHRKEVEGYPNGRKVLNLGHHKNMLGHPTTTAGALVSGGIARPVPMIPYNMGSLMVCSDQSDGQDEGDGGGTAAASAGVAYMGFPPPPPPPPSSHHHNQMLKKRFRTKFTPEQKEKLLSFADKVGWTIQKQEESVVQQFCQEIGIKRKVLKVWMHNNKHNLNKKSSPITDG